MRVIEKQMLAAINGGRDWSKDNTRVTAKRVDGMVFSDVFLHNHRIASVTMWNGKPATSVCKDTLREWPTRTTMSRLRALGVDVYTRKGNVILDNEIITRTD